MLAGIADRVATISIDRWLGGTHLRPDHLFRWDAATRRIATGGSTAADPPVDSGRYNRHHRTGWPRIAAPG